MFSTRSVAAGLVSVPALFLLSFLFLQNRNDDPGASSTDPTGTQMTADNYGSIPLHFEINAGQASEEVRFLARGNGYLLYLNSDEAVFALSKRDEGGEPRADLLRMKFVGSDPSPTITGEKMLEGKTNYLSGTDRSKWKTDIPNYARIRYQEIYDGVDVVFYGNQKNLEYDFVVQPNTSPDQIAIEFAGVDDISIVENGDLALTAGSNVLRQHKPIAYQEINGGRLEVEISYSIRNEDRRIGFQIGEYDHSQPLVIDPVLSFSTYLGGSSETFGTGIAVDSNGNAYVAGYTSSTSGFPLVGAFQNQNPGGNAAFVTKLNPAGTAFVYSTYLTGNSLGNSAAYSIAVDPAGNAYIAGISQSCNFPTTPGSYLPVVPNCGGNFKGFVVKMNSSGNGLTYGTYLSSPDFLFNGELTGIALDSSNNAYVTGWTGTATFPTTAGAFKRTLAANTQNAFVTKLNAAGSALVYSTFIGINTPVPNTDPYDRANAIAVDSGGNAYITGQSVSQNFPVTNTAFQTFPGSRLDAFVTKLNPTGTGLIYSTYLGGNGDEIGKAVAVDAGGNAYVTGSFDGTNGFPFTPNAFRNGAGENCCASVQNGFLSKINPTGTALVYSTSLGTERQAMSGTGIAVDNNGSAYVVGGQGINGAYTVNAVQAVSQNNDAFILKMNPAGTALTYSTNLGGVNGSSIGAAIAIDSSGGAYVTGSTNASNFPISAGAPQATKPGGQSNSSFIAKIATLPSDCPAITIDPQPLSPVVPGHDYHQHFTATGGSGPYIFTQAPGFGANNLPAGLTLGADGTISGTPTNTNFGNYIVTVQAVDANGCVGIRTFNLPYVQRTPALQISVTGRTAILRGRPNRYTIQYTNNADMDAFAVPLYIRFPDYLTWQAGENAEGMRVEQPVADQTVLSFTIDRIRARSSGSMALIITVPDEPQYANTNFLFEAVVGGPFPASSRNSSGAQTAHSDSHSVGSIDNSSRVSPSDHNPPDHFDAIGFIIFIITSQDPNDKVGPPGAGAARYIDGNEPLNYVINFENKATATAPAHTVVVTDQLDISKYDLSTFAFGDMTIAGQSFSPENSRTSLFKDFDLRPANNIIARIEASLDTTTGLLTWRLGSIDPATGLPTDEPLAGILPPNTAPPRGEGSVSFRVRLRSSVLAGTQINNQARIVFDTNAPIDTPVWSNTLDNSSPTSSVQPLPAAVPPNFTVSWAGTDTGSGIGSYTIFVSDNNGPFTRFVTNTTATSAVFSGVGGHTYRFYSMARDAAGNYEQPKTTVEATTTINLSGITGRVFTPAGLGLRNARVVLTDPNGVVRTATTSSFGVYEFNGIVGGLTYTLTASSKRYRFPPRILQVTEALTNVDFVGLE